MKAEEFLKENDIKLGEREGFNIMITDDNELFNEIAQLLEQYAEQESRKEIIDCLESFFRESPKFSANTYKKHAKKVYNWWELLPKCSHCGSTNIGAWGPDADKCFDCEMTWDCLPTGGKVMNLPEEIKKAIKTTLVLGNPQSIDIAVEKIMKILRGNKTKLPKGYHDVEEFYKDEEEQP